VHAAEPELTNLLKAWEVNALSYSLVECHRKQFLEIPE
jgi:hypothetical protein